MALCAAAAFGSGYAGVVYNNYQTRRMLSIATEKSWMPVRSIALERKWTPAL